MWQRDLKVFFGETWAGAPFDFPSGLKRGLKPSARSQPAVDLQADPWDGILKAGETPDARRRQTRAPYP